MLTSIISDAKESNVRLRVTSNVATEVDNVSEANKFANQETARARKASFL